MSTRSFDNPYSDFDSQKSLENNVKTRELTAKIQTKIDELLGRLEDVEPTLDHHDYSIYTGTTGIALLLYHLSKTVDGPTSQQRHLLAAKTIVDRSLNSLKGRRQSFLCGDAGPLALAAVIYDVLGEKKRSKDFLKRLHGLHVDVLDPAIPDEMLYGRVGYIYSLLFIQKHLGTQAADQAIINKVLHYTVRSGQDLAERERSDAPLMYRWHDKTYLGAAHGLAGILYILMQFSGEEHKATLEKLVQPTIDHLMTLKLPSGNWPSSVESGDKDRLVQWCHGAPGWVHMFIKAYQVFRSDKYKTAALTCVDVTWERGLLRKGYGICHGTAGNAYVFLALYNLTGEERHLYRALKFAEWCCDYGKHGCNTPDRPYSLFEGMAGTIHLLIDVLHTDQAVFPAFEL
ncbi:unnamed protein product [Owenia fusiformis]|uniref:Uncharacterized protein n=1 Tax=Owenia fusiformis TaxID=6347 RepID=A0A8J1Y302_OWEFU|nr:unnamed protein product [Owenia fusiformis]